MKRAHPNLLASSKSGLVHLLVAMALLACVATIASAQNIQNPQSAVDNLMRSSLKVDEATGAMQLQIPLGEYRGRVGANLPIKLSYSSKVWNIKQNTYSSCSNEPVTGFIADYAHSSASGWTSTLDWFAWPQDISLETYDSYTLKPARTPYRAPQHDCCSQLYRIDRLYMTLPDGSRHELRRDDARHDLSESLAGVYYAVDGSRLTYDMGSDTLFLPDGSRYVNVRNSGSLQYIDRNGNALSYDPSSGNWTDTLSRSISLPPLGGVAGDYPYSLQGVNGNITYTLRWKNLANALTDPTQQLHYKGDMTSANCGTGNPQSNNLFSTIDDQEKVLQSGIFNPVVLYQILLPNGTSYTFTYNVYGEIDKIIYPTGGSEQFTYGQVQPLGGQLDDGTYAQANRGVLTRVVSDGNTSQTWTYGTPNDAGVDPATADRSVTAPDGTMTKTWYYKSRGADIQYGFDDARTGMPREELICNSAGTMIRRTLYQLAEDGPQSGGYATATRNARVTRKVDIILDTGGNALAAATEITYDADLNVISTKDYDYVSIDQTTAQTADISSFGNGTLLRTEETTFLVNDPNIDASVRAAYRARNLLSLPTSSRVKDGNGNIVAQSSVAYDETSLQNIGSTNGWIDPQTAYRGNPTTTGSWLNTTNTYLTTHATYDQFGNVRTTTDAKGNQSQLDYAAAYSYAYPTTATSAVPDPTGQHGSPTAFVATSVFDLNTGLITSVTDANNISTTFEYADPLNRRTRTVRASGTSIQSQTSIAYDDSNHLITTTSDQNTFNDPNPLKSQIVYDGLGRIIESRQYEGGTNYIAVQTQYDALGRAFKSSNPFRPWQSESPVWTTSGFDALGRVTSLTTPDSAVVSTSYSGNTVTVADQAGKQRKSVTDALGRLVQVYEDPSGLNYLTSYSYDTLDNLMTVTQGAQTRSFVYDSLKRLTSATNPESGTVNYQYDNNGNLTQKIDARSITTTYVYDALNRVTSRTYSEGTPAVTYAYDSTSIANGKGRLASVTSSVSAYTFGDYDAMGRATGGTQTIGSQNYHIGYTYDLAGHVETMTYPSGRSITNTFDGAGRATSFTGNLGDGATRNYSTGVTYAAFGGLTQEQFGTTTAVYDKRHYNVRGQLYDVRVSTQSWTSDQWNWDRGAIINYYSTADLNASNDARANSGPDNNGNLLRQDSWVPTNYPTDFSYFRQSYTYDTLNRLKSVAEYLKGTTQTFAQTYSYDRYGNRTIDGANTWGGGINYKQFSVDPATNRLGVPSGQAGTMQYDPAGNLDVDTYSGLAVARVYDAENRMTQETQANSYVAGVYSYDGDGRRIKRIVGGVETWQVYGLGGELLAEYAANAAASSPQKEYGYRNGELLVTADVLPTTSTQNVIWTNAGGVSISGNSLSKTAAEGWDNAGAASQQRIVSGDGYVEFTAGNNTTWWMCGLSHTDPDWGWSSIDYAMFLTNWGHFYIYEKGVYLGDFGAYSAGDVLRVAIEGGVVKYRKNGALVYTSTAAPSYPLVVDTTFYSVGSTLNNAVISGNLGASSANLHWLVTDQLGTPRMIFDQSGSLTVTNQSGQYVSGATRHDYLPFGEELFAGTGGRTPQQGYSVSDGVRQHFTGYEADGETGLNFAQARYQSSMQGRFTSPDPILSSSIPTNPQTWNKYIYCLNNPLATVDPTGMWNWSVALGGNNTDDQLRQQLQQIREDETMSAEEQQQHIMEIDNILTQRQAFRDALDLANLAVDRADLSPEEQGADRAFLRQYGTENDNNGVEVAVRTSSGSGAAFTREENGKIIVAISPGELAKPSTLWLSVFHEGVHVFQSRFHSLTGLNPDLAGAESMAYHAEASLVRGLDSAMVRYGNAPSSQSYSAGTPPIVLWQRGWTEVDMRNGIQQHLQRLGLLDSSGNETTKGAKGAFPGGGAGQWQ